MAKGTDTAYRDQIMYCVFVRNYSKEGTFAEVEKDLSRIKELGTDIIWLMPIHPIGKIARKGSLGSPYAISDYRDINPEFGTLADFISLTEKIHTLGMKVIIDVVYNHTSPDSVLFFQHPEWFYRDKDGKCGNHVGAWSDVIDLDYTKRELWDYQIETLKMWARYVDGFRCDVAPFVPVTFWTAAREAVEEVRPDCLWLAESSEPPFIQFSRIMGVNSHSDSELYSAFDLCYDYDCHDLLKGTLSGENTWTSYAEMVSMQENIYPENYVKLRFFENHDQPRAAQLAKDENLLRSLSAFCAFQKGTFLIYAGQEYGADHTPSLFDKDTVSMAPGLDLSELFKKMAAIKKDIPKDSFYRVSSLGEKALLSIYLDAAHVTAGIFPLCGEAISIALPKADSHSPESIWNIPDGTYEDRFNGAYVQIDGGKLKLGSNPVIFSFKKEGIVFSFE